MIVFRIVNGCGTKIVDGEAEFKLIDILKPIRNPGLDVDPPYMGRVAYQARSRALKTEHTALERHFNLEIDDDAKEIVREIGTAINESVENSSKVADAIDRLRDAGYEMELTLRLEIGLRPHAGDETESEAALNLTDEDVQVLQRMKIRIDPEEQI